MLIGQLKCKNCRYCSKIKSDVIRGANRKRHGGYHCCYFHKSICGHKLVKTKPKWCTYVPEKRGLSFKERVQYIKRAIIKFFKN